MHRRVSCAASRCLGLPTELHCTAHCPKQHVANNDAAIPTSNRRSDKCSGIQATQFGIARLTRDAVQFSSPPGYEGRHRSFTRDPTRSKSRSRNSRQAQQTEAATLRRLRNAHEWPSRCAPPSDRDGIPQHRAMLQPQASQSPARDKLSNLLTRFQYTSSLP